jgi:hypothetical protein
VRKEAEERLIEKRLSAGYCKLPVSKSKRIVKALQEDLHGEILSFCRP